VEKNSISKLSTGTITPETPHFKIEPLPLNGTPLLHASLQLLFESRFVIPKCAFFVHISASTPISPRLPSNSHSAHHSLDVAFLAGESKQTAFNGAALLNRDGHIKKSRKPSMERVSDMPVVREIA